MPAIDIYPNQPGNIQPNVIVVYEYTEPNQRAFAPNETQHVVLIFGNAQNYLFVGATLAGDSGNGTAEVISTITVPVDNGDGTFSVLIYWHNTMPIQWNISVKLKLFLHWRTI
jgi:hypothetical protein